MVYIQSNEGRVRPHHFDAACAMYGCIETGEDYHLVPFDMLDNGSYNERLRRNLCVGSVEFMNEVFKRIGITAQPRVPINSNRHCRTMSLSEVMKLSEDVFIKPLKTKLFTGFVLDGFQYTCLDKIPGDTTVLVYEPFKSRIISEWRVYIHNNKVVYAGNYAGDPLLAPCHVYVDERVQENGRSFPVSYTIDIGILYGGENVVIEYNDMWAIGNYGMPNDLYLRLLKDRYFQIISNKSNNI